MAKTIRQTVTFDSPPHEVFEALIDAKSHAAFTGDDARITRRVGGRFSVFGGYATGTTTRLEADTVIGQTWRSTDFAPEDKDSMVMFHLSKKGPGTRLVFVHSGVPDRLADDIAEGWHEFYWKPLKAFLGAHTSKPTSRRKR